RSVRNNNPGNIEDSAFARSQPGYQGSDGRFAIFADPGSGAAAQAALLGNYVRKGLDTPLKIISRWAPAGDGANNPQAYASTVARALGIGPNDKISPEMLPALAQAMARVEGGAASPSNGPAIAAAPERIVGNPKPTYRMSAPEEVKAQGLDPA
ncbi:hypothetical protein OY671_012137, partial [Metschnikowia pulcherrima]